MSFLPTPNKLFFSKNDPQDIRLGDLVKPRTTDLLIIDNSFAILGYPDDEGIRMNGGRTGANEAPLKIREFLYKMTPPDTIETESLFSDLGDLKIEGDLASRHQAAKLNAFELFQKQIKVLSFGGGHDYGYADTAAFVENYKNSFPRPLVLNFDAHMDVRPADKGFNSGTPFRRLLEEHHESVDFIEIGIQPQCNSLHHKAWARDKGAIIYDLSEILKDGGLTSLLDKHPFDKLHPETPVFISFDIDSLTSSEAGGCSQSWVTGIHTQDYLNFFHELKKKSSLRGLGIYEVSPSLDIDNRTSKTAAIIAYNFLFQDLL